MEAIYTSLQPKHNALSTTLNSVLSTLNSVMPPLSSLLGLSADKLVESLAKAADRFINTAEDKARLEQALRAEVDRHLEAEAAAISADRASARTRETTLRNALGVWVQNGAAAAVVLAYLGLLVGLFFAPLAPANQRLADALAGALSGIVLQLFQYWFGSSAGSVSKQAFIEGRTE